VRVWTTAARFVRDPIPVLRSLHERYGSIVAFANNPFRQWDPRLYVMAFGPKYNEQILTDTETFRARGFVPQGPQGSAHQRVRFGLISMNGEQHRRHRALLMPAFHRRAVDGYRDAIAELTNRTVASWKIGERRDIAQDMRALALNVASAVLFGYHPDQPNSKLGGLIERWMASCFSPGVWFFQWNLHGLPYRRLLGIAEQLENEVRLMIRQRRQEPLGDDILSVLIRACDGDSEAMTEDELVGEISVVFTAAHETNTVALTWTLFLLSQHPRILRDLVDELEGELHGDAPRVDHFDRLPLLERVIKESLRILPPVAWGTRAVDRTTPLGPFLLPKGSRVLYSQYVTHHSPDIYPNPRKFDPDRWLSFSPSAYAYIPFGGGPRLCIGYIFSMTLLRISLAIILQRFHLGLAPGTRIERKYQVTVAPKDGMPMIIYPKGCPVERAIPTGPIHDTVDLNDPSH
jgi:cytochrome P450